MSPLNHEEVNKLAFMYEGDKSRDASDKIRGFLFQDYITINCLLQNGVECVCSEYLEDVDVFYEDGRFEFIQVKYYPKTSPDMNEISTDLYYQYLRLQMLQSKLRAIPKLYIHRKVAPEKPTVEEMKEYIGLGENTPKLVTYPNVVDSIAQLKMDVYSIKTKAEQKKKLFTAMASEKSLEEFHEQFEISCQSEITLYKQELMERLAKIYPNSEPGREEERWNLILLGLAISRVQQRYLLSEPKLEDLRVVKEDFDQYMTNSVQMKTERTIASYLVGGVAEVYEEIINHNDLSELQLGMIGRIYQKTVQWIEDIGMTPEGQYQLLNTLSRDEVSKIVGYKEKTIGDRLISMAECKEAFGSFLKYLWKIMLNICQERIETWKTMDENPKLFDPRYYLVSSVTDYVCLNFPEDKSVEHSVILPKAGSEFKGVKRKILERIVEMSPKPEKWFFDNNKLTRGKNYYSYSTADVNENPTVVDLGKDSFYIECMDCIGIDEDEWGRREACSECIFSMKCVKEGI